jgi:ribonuclease P/MRP protein subunit POP5
MKPILPVLREKKRYLAFEIISEKNISNSSASKALNQAFIEYVGFDGYSEGGFLFLNELYNSEKKTGIIRISSNKLDKLKSSLVFLKKINGENVIIKTKISSGIIKKAKIKR